MTAETLEGRVPWKIQFVDAHGHAAESIHIEDLEKAGRLASNLTTKQGCKVTLIECIDGSKIAGGDLTALLASISTPASEQNQKQ